MTKSKLIPLNICIFILLSCGVNVARAEYYFACSPPPAFIERVDYYTSDRPRWAAPKYHHSCAKRYYKKHKHHHYVKKYKPYKRYSRYSVSTYYVWPAVPPCPSCVVSTYSYAAPCGRCETGYWQVPRDSYYQTRGYYYSDYDQDMRTDDDIGAQMNIDY